MGSIKQHKIKQEQFNWFGLQLQLIVFSICLFMAVFMVIDSGIDYDVVWHIKQGEIYASHGVTTTDYLSWQPGLKWTTAEWLYEVLIYWFVKYSGVIGFTALLALSTYSIYGWALKRSKYNHPFIYFLLFGVTFLFPKNIYNRPGEFQIIIQILMIYWVLYKRDKLYIKSIIIGLFLANFHGGQVVTMLAAIGIITVVTEVHQIISDQADVKKQDIGLVKQDIVSMILMFLQSLINPMGIEMYIVGMKVPGMYSTKFITEWQVWDIDYASGVVILLVIIAIATQNRFKRFDLNTLNIVALISAFTILSVKTQRLAGYLQALIIIFGYDYIVEFYEWLLSKIEQQQIHKISEKLKSGMPLGINEDEWKIYQSSLADKLNRLMLKTTRTEAKQSILGDAAIHTETDEKTASERQKIVYQVLCIGIVQFNLIYLISSCQEYKTFGDLVDKNTEYQIEIAEYMLDNNISDNVYTGYTTGDWLIWNGLKSFIDSRQQPFTKEISNNESLDDTIKAVQGPDVFNDIQTVFDKYDIKYVLWDSGEMGIDIADRLVDTGKWKILLKATDSKADEYLLERVESIDRANRVRR